MRAGRLYGWGILEGKAVRRGRHLDLWQHEGLTRHMFLSWYFLKTKRCVSLLVLTTGVLGWSVALTCPCK